MYIYKITNKLNGKIYIGQCSGDIDATKKYYGSGKLIKLAIEKYGIENFEKEILETCADKNSANVAEIFYIKKYDTIKCGYNISTGGNGGDLGKITNEKISSTIKNMWKNGAYNNVKWPTTRLPLTEKTKHKISEAQSGEKGYWFGKKLSHTHRNKIKRNTILAHTRDDVKIKFLKSVQSVEHRKKLSNSHKGIEPWNKGKTDVYSDETLKRMSNSAKHRTTTVENETTRRNKISKWFSENHPNVKQIVDTRDDRAYKSLTEFCKQTNTSWYKTKRMRREGIIIEK